MSSYTVGDYDAKLQGRAVKWDSQPLVGNIVRFLEKFHGTYTGFEIDVIVDKIHITPSNSAFHGITEAAFTLRLLYKTGLPWVLEIQ